MRIIAGEWRGRKLVAPKGEVTRPTADRTRETLFSMLASRLGTFEGLRVADMFAGSGALGIEALSRGAAHCLFVENDRSAMNVIRENLASLDATNRAAFESGSVLSLRPAGEKYDLILLDPPYRTTAGAVALERLLRLDWIGEATWVALETAFNDEPVVNGLTIETTRKVGKGRITLFRLETGRDEKDTEYG